MPSLHLTTKIKSSQTAPEVVKLLVSMEALSACLFYEEFEPVGILFALNCDGHTFKYKLPVNWRDVFEVMKRDVKVSRSVKTAQQARRAAWRILKGWLEAQLVTIESGQARAQVVFLPYVIDLDGQWLREALASEPYRLLAGRSDEVTLPTEHFFGQRALEGSEERRKET